MKRIVRRPFLVCSVKNFELSLETFPVLVIYHGSADAIVLQEQIDRLVVTTKWKQCCLEINKLCDWRALAKRNTDAYAV